MYHFTFWYSVYLEVHPVPLRFLYKNQQKFDEAKSFTSFKRFTVAKSSYYVLIFHETFQPE